MLKADIKPGAEYALRETRIRSTPLQRVRIVDHMRGSKWTVEWIDPIPGLVHNVESGQPVVPWNQHKAFLKDDNGETRLLEHQ